MRNLAMHIGLHKTGSTLVQHVLGEIAPQLARLSVRYDRETCRRLSIYLRSEWIEAPGHLDHLRDRFAEAARTWSENDLVLSEENFFGRHRRGYADSERMAERLR